MPNIISSIDGIKDYLLILYQHKYQHKHWIYLEIIGLRWTKEIEINNKYYCFIYTFLIRMDLVGRGWKL